LSHKSSTGGKADHSRGVGLLLGGVCGLNADLAALPAAIAEKEPIVTVPFNIPLIS
jgi:hypothetical protein